MSIALTNPQPNPPKAGRAFSITAVGEPNYEFSYSFGGGFYERLPEQEGATLIIFIPVGKEGETLYVNVTDGDGKKGAWSGIIGRAASKVDVSKEDEAEK